MPSRALPILAAPLLLALACRGPGAAPAPAPARVAVPDTSPYAVVRPRPGVLHRIILIGDAGKAKDGDSVMVALHEVAAQHPSTTVLFLGDNAYPCGITRWTRTPPAICRMRVPPGTAESPAEYANRQARSRLMAQIHALGGTQAQGYFIPGNHDWYGDTIAGRAGADAIRREGEIIRQARDSSYRVAMLPDNTCPGPESIDLPRVRLIILDTQRLLRIFEDARRRQPRLRPPPDCRFWTPAQIGPELARLVRGARDEGREVVVASHHPPVTYGSHCPRFTRRAINWLRGPGERAVTRDRFGPQQDVRTPAYDRMRLFMAETFQESPPLVYAGGHDHSLQVIRTRLVANRTGCALAAAAAANVIVSGAGSNLSAVKPWAGLQPDVPSARGFVVLDVSPDEFRVRIVQPAAILRGAHPDNAAGYVLTR
ncbi:MAG TPA: hypothetical protein VF092_11115 [Longimicrobium sp.]